MSDSELLCCCDDCNDGDGNCVFPYYGLAPHSHGGKEFEGSAVVGSTELKPKSQWTENFFEDAEVPGLGTYGHCLTCNRPNDEKLWYQDQETKRKRAALAGNQ